MARTRLVSIVLLLVCLGPDAACQAEEGKDSKYALLVGVKEYNHTKLPSLQYTENDVTDLAKLLVPAGYKVTLLSDTEGAKEAKKRPTAENIQAAVRALLADKGKHHTVLVALAGHGMQLQVPQPNGKAADESFFCPSDAQFNDPKKLISLKQLFADLDQCGAGVKLLLVDACRNDAGDLGMRSLDADAVPRPPRGIAALFSCASGQRAFETKALGGGHGVFFHFVLQGLRGEARDEDGDVDWGLLSRYVTRQVSRQVPKLIGGGAQQTPHEVKNLVGASPVLLKIPAQTEAEELYRRGLRLLLGQDGTINEAEAFKQFQRAEEKGYARARGRLAVCLWNGIGTDKNEAQAVRMARQALKPVQAAAAADDGAAQALLGYLFLRGLAVKKDEVKAAELFHKAAENDDAIGMVNLGIMYQFGRGGVKKDLKEAVAWYSKAAEKGHAGAMMSLGAMYQSGLGVPKKDDEAFKWIQKAAQKGHVKAMRILGMMYEEGFGVEKDRQEAVKWYRQAAARGNKDARAALKSLGE